MPSPTRSGERFAAVTASLSRAIRRTRDLGLLYADDDWSPLSDLTLALLLKRANVRWTYAPLEGLVEIVWPPICGAHVMLVERAQTPGEKRFAVRHGLGHVLASHVDEVSYARDGHDPFALEETVADLFAIVDLVPRGRLGQLAGAGYSAAEIERWLMCELRRYVPSWPDDRLHDRIDLRLRLPL